MIMFSSGFWCCVASSVDAEALKMETVVSPKRCHLLTSVHGAKTQKNIIT
jgi:hypothetical protein